MSTVGSRKRVAIIGGGISGIACAWRLRNEDFDVDIYEAEERLGGHANSVPFVGNGITVGVDTGYMVMSTETYPRFHRFLKELNLETVPADMSFGVSAYSGEFEWGSYSFWSFVGHLSYLLKPWFWRLLFDIIRFCYFAKDTLVDSTVEGKGQHDEAIADYLHRHGYSEQFLELFLIPMVAAVWSTDLEEFKRSFPAKTLIRFMFQNRLLDTVTTSLQWRAFPNGSQTYVRSFMDRLPPNHHIHAGQPIHRVSRTNDGAIVTLANGVQRQYEHVVLATHANQALTLMGTDATAEEREVLGCFKTSRNVCYVHSDETVSLSITHQPCPHLTKTQFLAKRPSARTAWTCLLSDPSPPPMSHPSQLAESKPLLLDEPKPFDSSIALTFDMNKVQRIPMPGQLGSPGRVLVSMNPPRIPAFTQSSQVYYHPLLTAESLSAVDRLCEINGRSSVSFAGAWIGLGFHEDGFASGAHAAEMIVRGRENVGRFEPLRRDERVPERYSFADRVVRGCVSAVQRLL
ncbi:FAD/NAD(P)-binding domain-containing protein [Pseudovirgaria hyperparasitica]|uniref:FAD/NAD(P)-binding domain-containing protein n=1 Tax=Pseudovirgaria hyperparasitica TaxID=470096 RepID=A0A6A6WD59_9PEZI|nr:FAD/NAD(P)-binding domain-containing protein [Pseudovirgaria hyperparasitica]KAF2759041.1 FAD/NAD(P)-binding domain-containing protein [Pseudovirgaria hyperparasitica]